MSPAAPSASLRSLFSELEQLFQTETEARVSTSVRAAERALAEHLNQSVRRLRHAAGLTEVAAILCDASVPFATTCGVFQVTDGMVTGHCARGAADGFGDLHFAISEAGAFAGAVESREPVVALGSASEVSPAVAESFAHGSGDKAWLYPLIVGRAVAGIFYASGKVENAALELLTQAAAAVLEAVRKPPAANLVRIEGVSASPAPDWDALSAADRHLHLRAQRFARVQVAEMRLYQAEAVKSGRAQGQLYTALRETIDGAREAFRESFVGAAPNMVDYLHREMVRTLANDNPAALGDQYPGPLL